MRHLTLVERMAGGSTLAGLARVGAGLHGEGLAFDNVQLAGNKAEGGLHNCTVLLTASGGGQESICRRHMPKK